MLPKIQFLLVFLFLLSDLLAQPSINFTSVASGFTRPVDISNANDGTDRLFIVEKAGLIKIISDIDAGTVLGTPFLNISGLVDDAQNEQGLLGLAFDPNYSTNGYFYVNYTYDPGPGLDRTRIARYTVDANDANLADLNSAVTILEIAQDFANHNGGDLAFGPDGMLYIGMGDGGSGGDPNCRAQDMTALLGKILRIDVHETPPPIPNDLCGLVTNYGIPEDNPFLGGTGHCDEIWAVGVRNPWRISFDRSTGDLWVADVGQNQREEIDLIYSGSNYGWKVMEGTFCHDPNPIDPDCPAGTASCGDVVYEAPVFEYNHGLGCSVTGGYVYRGNEYPGMQGYYLFMDYCSNRIWSLISDGGGGWDSDVTTLGGFGNITTFGEDESGELYVASDGSNASIYQVIDLNPLPVSLISFIGQITPSGNLLNWKTATLENFDHFIIEKSSDGRSFLEVGSVEAPENLASEQTFSFLDKSSTNGEQYYRLKMLDKDQRFSYSELVHLNASSLNFSVYPNPSTGIIFIDFANSASPSEGNLRLFDLKGKLISEKKIEATDIFKWDLSTFEKGIYFLEVKTKTQAFYQKLLLR